ncbi:hypothetical protein Tco_0797176 [Tanacetum coccineum]
MAYWGFLGVGTMFDILLNILFPYSLNTAYCSSLIWRIRSCGLRGLWENGRMILSSVLNGPLIWPTVTEADGTTRTKNYEELSANPLRGRHRNHNNFSRFTQRPEISQQDTTPAAAGLHACRHRGNVFLEVFRQKHKSLSSPDLPFTHHHAPPLATSVVTSISRHPLIKHTYTSSTNRLLHPHPTATTAASTIDTSSISSPATPSPRHFLAITTAATTQGCVWLVNGSKGLRLVAEITKPGAVVLGQQL